MPHAPGTGNIRRTLLLQNMDIIVVQYYGRKTFPPQSIFYLIFIFTTQLNAALLSLFIVTVLVPLIFGFNYIFLFVFIKTLFLMMELYYRSDSIVEI